MDGAFAPIHFDTRQLFLAVFSFSSALRKPFLRPLICAGGFALECTSSWRQRYIRDDIPTHMPARDLDGVNAGTGHAQGDVFSGCAIALPTVLVSPADIGGVRWDSIPICCSAEKSIQHTIFNGFYAMCTHAPVHESPARYFPARQLLRLHSKLVTM